MHVTRFAFPKVCHNIVSPLIIILLCIVALPWFYTDAQHMTQVPAPPVLENGYSFRMRNLTVTWRSKDFAAHLPECVTAC